MLLTLIIGYLVFYTVAVIIIVMTATKRSGIMPIQQCSSNGKPGYSYGDEGFCYTYMPGNEQSRKAAKHKAYLQGVAIARRTGEEMPDEDSDG